MMAVRKEQNQGIHPCSFEKANVNDNEDEDEDDEDNHFIISLEDNGEEDGLLCSPEDISFSTSDKQTLGVSPDVNKQLGEERTTSRYTIHSDLGANGHNNFDKYNRQIFTFATSIAPKDQITLNNSELDKCSSSHLSATCVEPESSSIPTSSSNNNSSRPRKSIQLVNPPPPALSCIANYTAGKPNDRTSESAQVKEGESHKANKKSDFNLCASDPLNSQSVENSKLDGLTPKKSLVSKNFSSSDKGLETIKLGAESGGIWSEAIFLSRTQNGPHDVYPFSVSNINTSECGDEIIGPQKPSNLDTAINVQKVDSSGPSMIFQNCSSIYSLPALSSFKPLDSSSYSSATLSSQPASCVPRLSGPYPRIDKNQGQLSGPISSSGDVPESSLPEATADSNKHAIADDSADCTCIMCYKSSCPNTPDPKSFVIDLEKRDGVFDAKVGINNKRKRSSVLQKARKRKEAQKFIDIYVLPRETNANKQVQLKINGSGNTDWQSKVLGNNLARESPNLLPSPIIRPCTNNASPALPLNTICTKSSLVLTRTLPSSQMTTDAMAQVSASFPRSLNAQNIPEGKQLKLIQSVNRPIAPKVFISLAEVLGKDETSCAADPSCSVATQHIGTSITSSDKSIPSKEKTFVSTSLATLRSLNFKHLHEEAVHNTSKEEDSKCITSTTEQPSQLSASRPEADASVKVNPTMVSDTEASKGSDKAEGPPVIVLKDRAHLLILNNILKKRQLEMCSTENISSHLQDPKALKAPVSNKKINSPKITVLTEPPREPIYAKSLLSPRASTSIVSTNFTMHYHHAASSTTKTSLQSSAPSISADATVPHVSLPTKCTFISSFQRQSGIGNKNLVYSLLKDNFQKAGPTNSSQMVDLSNKLPPEKKASPPDYDLKVMSSNLKDENCGTPSYENESFGSSCNTPTPHPPEERLPKSYIEDWVNQAKTYTCETLQQEPRTQGSDLNSVKSKPVYEEVASIHNYTRRASSVEGQSNLTTEVNHDDGTRTTLILPVAAKLKLPPQTPANLGLSLTPGNVSDEDLLSHTMPSAGTGIQKPAKLYSLINRADESSSLTQSSPVGERTDPAMANNLLSPSDSVDCVKDSDNLSPTKVAKSNPFNRCLTGGRSRLISQSRKRNTVFKSSLEPRRTTSSTVVPSSNGIKLKIRFDAFHKKTQKTLDPLIGKIVESASDTSVLENEHLNKDNQTTIKDSEIMSSAPKPTLPESVGNERVETAEEMFQRFQKQAMQEVFKAQLGVGNLSRNLRPARASLAFLDKPSWRSRLEYSSKKKKREEDKTSNPISKTDDASSTISAFSKDSGDKRLLGGNKKRHSSEDGSVSVKQARLSIKDYPKLKEDNSITSKKKVVCSNILAGHKVFVKFNTYENIHTGRSFLVPFFNIGGTRTQFDVEDMEYISKAVVDYEKEEKSCARHLLFHAREGNKASFLRKENYHHSSKITEKNYKKCSFVLEGFQRHASKQALPVVERWTVDSAVDIEIDRAEVDPDEEEHFASMIESRCSQSDAVSGNEFVTPEEAISKSKDNVASGIEIDIAEGDSNAEEEFALQMASKATCNVETDNVTHIPLGSQLEPLSSSDGVSPSSHPHILKRNRLEVFNSSNGFSKSSYPLILKRNVPPIHNVLKDLVSSTHQDSRGLPRSNSYTVEATSTSSKEHEPIRPDLSGNMLSPKEDRGIKGVQQEANCSFTVNQNSVVVKTEVPDTGYGDMSSVEPPHTSSVSIVIPAAPCVPLVKDEPIDEYFDTLSTLVTRRQVVQDAASMQSTNDVVSSEALSNLLEPRESNDPLSSMTLSSKVQLVSSPISTEQVISQSLNIPLDNVNKITMLEPTAAVSPNVPYIFSKSDNNLRGKTNATIDISVKSITENCTVVNDTETNLNNTPMSVVSFENLEALVVIDSGERADQLENITIRKIFNETVSPVATESTVTADEMGNPESPLPSSSISESSDISSYSDVEDPVADELSQIKTMSHGQCPSPDKQNPVQSKITSLVESLRQRLTQQTPSLPSWLSTDKVPRVRSKIKLKSKAKSRKITLDSNENIDVAKDPLSIEPPSVQSLVTCEKGTTFLHSPVSFIPTVESIQHPATHPVENIQNPATKSMLLESSPPVSTLLPHTGPSFNELLPPNSSTEPHFSKHRPASTPSCIELPNAVPSVTRPSSVEHNIEDVSTETMHLPVITPGETKTQPDSASPSVQECLLSKEVEYFSKVQPLPTSISYSLLTLPQSVTFSVVHPNHASSRYTLPTTTNSMGHIPQTSSIEVLPLRHGKNNVEDKNCMNNTQQISLPCPTVPSLTLDSNRSTPSDFEIEVGTEDNFEDDGKFRPIHQPKLRKLSWKDYAAPYSRLVPTSLSDSPPMSPWGLPSGGPSTSAIFHQDQQRALLNNSVLTNQHAKNVSQNISKRRKRVKNFRGKKSTEKKIPVTPSALDEFTPTETAESVTSYLTKKFSSTPGSKIKGPRLLHDPSKKKATPQKSESDTSLAPASQILPGPISTAELSKTPSLSEIFGIEIKNNAKSLTLATDTKSAKSQVEAKGGANKEILQVAKKRTSQVAKKKTSQVARKKTSQTVMEKRSQVAKKRTSGKKKGLGATQKFNSKLDVTDITTGLKTSDRLETSASDNTFKLLSPESQDVIQPTSDNFESRQPAIKNELLQPLDDAKPSTNSITKTGFNAETPLNLPKCTVALHKLEDLKTSYELRDGVYFVKGAKSEIIKDHKSKESSVQSSALKQGARKIIKRKKKKSKVNRKQPVVRQKKDIVDYYMSMLESLQKKALQLEEESRKEREENAKKEHDEGLRKEMKEKTQKESAEKTTQKAGETDEANPSDKSGIETGVTRFEGTFYDHNINEDLQEEELNEEADLIKLTDDGHLLTAKTVAASEPSKGLSFKGMGLVTENEVPAFPDFDIDKSDLTSDVLLKNHSDNDKEKLNVLADKKLQGPEDGENAGHEERTNCVLQEINAAEGHRDYIYGKEPLDKHTVFEKKDIVLCSSFDEEMLKMSSGERQKIAAEEDMLLGQAEDFDGDDIGVIPQIEVERLLGLDTNATSPDTLDDFNLELKDQISIMEQLKDGDLIEPEMDEVTKKQSALKNEGRFLFGDSPDVKRSGSLEIKRDNPKISDPSQSFESALKWVNIPEPSESISPQDTVSLVSSKPMDAEVKHSEVQNNFKVQLKFQTASLIKSIKLSKEMKNVFGEAASGGNSPTEDKKNTYEKVLSQSENTDMSLENPCSAASSASELPLTKSSHPRPPIPKLKVRLRRETIEAIEKAKANFVSSKRGEKKQANGSKGKFVRNTDKSEVQLQEDMQFYLRSSNSQSTPPESPVRSQGQLLHSSPKIKSGFPSRRAIPRLDPSSRATRSKCLSQNNAPLKVTVNSNFEAKQSTNKTVEGIFSSVHLFDEPLECSGSVIPAAACDTNKRSSVTTKPSQLICDTNTGSSDTTKPRLSLKPLVKPLTIDIVKLKMKLNPLFSIKARQNGSKSQETELKSPSMEPKNIASPVSHPSTMTNLSESSANLRDAVTSVSAFGSETVPGHAAFSNSSPQVVLKKLPTLNTAKLCNILKSFQKQTNNKEGQETFKGSSESTAFSNTSGVLGSSLVTKRSSPRALRGQKSAVGAARGGRALRSSAKNVQVSSSNFVGEESKNFVENSKQLDPASNPPANPKTVTVKQFKEADDKGERSFFDCLTDVSHPSDWVDM